MWGYPRAKATGSLPFFDFFRNYFFIILQLFFRLTMVHPGAARISRISQARRVSASSEYPGEYPGTCMTRGATRRGVSRSVSLLDHGRYFRYY